MIDAIAHEKHKRIVAITFDEKEKKDSQSILNIRIKQLNVHTPFTQIDMALNSKFEYIVLFTNHYSSNNQPITCHLNLGE